LTKRSNRPRKETNLLANPVLGDLTAAVSNIVGVVDSAVALINGIAARVEAAVAAALVNGATEAELAPVAAEVAALNENAAKLAEAVAANSA